MLKRALTIIILLVALAVFGHPLYFPVNYAGKVAQAQSGPDLTVEAITSSPETPTIGDAVTFTVTINNQGTTASGQFYLAYYIDGDYLTRDYLNSLGPGANAEQTFTWTAEAGTHAITAVADYKNQVTESNESNNQKTYTLSTLSADLIIDSVTWSPSEPSVASSVAFTITVKNQGSAVATSARVHFYIDDTSRGYKDIERLDPKETGIVTFSWFSKAGQHEIKAIVDKNDTVTEADENNNEMTILFSPLLPDLLIDEITWSPEEPSVSDNVTFTVFVSNQGGGKSGTSTIDFYIDDALSDTEWIDEIEAGASGNVTFSWIAEEGIHEVKAIVTSGDVFIESDETNNEKTVILSPPLPDLIVQNITWSPTNPSVRDEITFTVTVENQGSGPSEKLGVDLHIDDVSAGYQELDGISAGNTMEATFTWRAEAGSHQIEVSVDSQDDVAESDELNNEKTVTFSTLPPDLVIEQITWTPPEPTIGDTVTVTVKVKNQGEGMSDFAYIAYYVDGSRLTSDRTNMVSPNATDNQTFTWTITKREHTIKALVDSSNMVDESDETNNEKTVILSPQLADLVIQSLDWSRNDPLAGDPVTFTVSVANNGSIRAASSLVHLYIDNSLRGYQHTPPMDPGEKATQTFDWTVEAGPHTIRAVVDNSNLVIESNEANNETQIGYPMPDLTIEGATWNPTEPAMGDKVTLTAYVKNIGSRRAEGFQVYFYVDDTVVNQQDIPQLDAGTRVIKTFEWDVAAGQHVLALFADGADTIAEGAENNNTETVNFSIPAPDLIIESIAWPSEESPASDNVAFTVTIKNQGDAKASYASVNYYLDGERLASGEVSSLEPDEYTEEVFSTWIPQVGPHTIKVVIDEGNQVLESNEVNNEKTVDFSTENVTAPAEQVPAANTQPRQERASPIPIQLTPPEENDLKMPVLVGIVVAIFGATLVFSLLRELRKRR